MDERRAGRYERILKQLEELIDGKSPSLLAAMSTICAILHAKMRHHFWTGFYFVKTPDELHVGPYQGAVACQVLRDSGVCIEAARGATTVIVPDVEAFPGHIACDSRARSEIAIPVMRGDEVIAVFDVDADKPGQFSEEDGVALHRILDLLLPYI